MSLKKRVRDVLMPVVAKLQPAARVVERVSRSTAGARLRRWRTRRQSCPCSSSTAPSAQASRAPKTHGAPTTVSLLHRRRPSSILPPDRFEQLLHALQVRLSWRGQRTLPSEEADVLRLPEAVLRDVTECPELDSRKWFSHGLDALQARDHGRTNERSRQGSRYDLRMLLDLARPGRPTMQAAHEPKPAQEDGQMAAPRQQQTDPQTRQRVDALPDPGAPGQSDAPADGAGGQERVARLTYRARTASIVRWIRRVHVLDPGEDIHVEGDPPCVSRRPSRDHRSGR